MIPDGTSAIVSAELFADLNHEPFHEGFPADWSGLVIAPCFISNRINFYFVGEATQFDDALLTCFRFFQKLFVTGKCASTSRHHGHNLSISLSTVFGDSGRQYTHGEIKHAND